MPLVHAPGHAQAEFGEAIGIIGGVERKIHFFAFDLPHSDACFVVGYPAETTEAFCDAIADTARTLEDLRREGKIRAIGVSNYSPAQMDAFRVVAKLDTVQPPYNLFEREIEADVLPYAIGTGL